MSRAGAHAWRNLAHGSLADCHHPVHRPRHAHAAARAGSGVTWPRRALAEGRQEPWRAHLRNRRRYVPYRATRDIDEGLLDEAFPGREKLRGLASITHDVKYVLIDAGLDQLRDLEALHAAEPFDLVISDVAFLGAQLFYERTRVPLVVINPLPLFITSRDLAPLGMPLPPSSSAARTGAQSCARLGGQNLILRDVRDHFGKVRTGLGLDPRARFIDCQEHTSVVLQASIPGLEYPRSDLPDNVHFIGQLPLEPPPTSWRRRGLASSTAARPWSRHPGNVANAGQSTRAYPARPRARRRTGGRHHGGPPDRAARARQAPRAMHASPRSSRTQRCCPRPA